MAPEAVMLLIDSSEYMRNGDFQPTRFEAQSDAISVLFSAKINSNPENTVGVMTMGGAGGKGPEVLATPTADLGKVLSAMHKASIGGESDLITGINVAQLALKHRQNKTQRQRIIILIGSPVTESSTVASTSSASSSSPSSSSSYEKDLIKLGKKLKKNNVAVDVVSFAGKDGEGEGVGGGAGGAASSMSVDETTSSSESVGQGQGGGMEGVLRRFVESVGSGDNSHFLSISPGPRLLSDMIVSSPILAGEDAYGGQGGAFEDVGSAGGGGGGGAGSAGGQAGGNNFEFGVDPEMDPELAMVLRMSMEEEQARLAAAQQQQQQQSSSSSSSSVVPPPSSSSASDPSTSLVPPASQPPISIPMTSVSSGPTATAAPLVGAAPGTSTTATDADEEGDEELRRALEMSSSTTTAVTSSDGDVPMDDEEEEDEDEEEAIRKAIEMSMQEDQAGEKKA